jgi:hypothetical protein
VRLIINDQDVSYSLEAEKTLGEVVKGIHSWLAAAGFVVTAVRADDREIAGAGMDNPVSADDSWGSTRVDSVSFLRVTASRTGDMKIAHWRTFDTWLEMLEDELKEPADGRALPPAGSSDPLEDLLEGLSQTMEGLAANPFLPPGSDAGKRFAALFAGKGAPAVRAWTPGTRGEALDLIRDLRTLVQARVHDVTHPRESLARCAEGLAGCMGELKEVSVLLQTGRDKPAMDTVVRFTDIVQSLMDLLPFLAPDPERGRLLSGLTPVLRELVEAFGSRDSVLIGDLLEYEVAPRLEKIVPLLSRAGVVPEEQK